MNGTAYLLSCNSGSISFQLCNVDSFLATSLYKKLYFHKNLVKKVLLPHRRYHLFRFEAFEYVQGEIVDYVIMSLIKKKITYTSVCIIHTDILYNARCIFIIYNLIFECMSILTKLQLISWEDFTQLRPASGIYGPFMTPFKRVSEYIVTSSLGVDIGRHRSLPLPFILT